MIAKVWVPPNWGQTRAPSAAIVPRASPIPPRRAARTGPDPVGILGHAPPDLPDGRPGELFALDRADLDGDVLHVTRAARSAVREIGPPKNGRPRDVICPPRAVRALEHAPRLHPTRAFSSVTGRQLWAPTMSMLWRPVRHAARLPEITLHHLRHYCATQLVEAGVAPWDVAVQLGQRDGGQLVMDRYGHPSERLALDRVRMSATADHSPTTADPRGNPPRMAEQGGS